MQVTDLFVLLHLKITNVSLRQNMKTKNNSEFFNCAILWKHPKDLDSQRFPACQARDVQRMVDGEGKFHVIDRAVCGPPGIKGLMIVNKIIINTFYAFVILIYNNNKNTSNRIFTTASI